jgi:hypothetical protein
MWVNRTLVSTRQTVNLVYVTVLRCHSFQDQSRALERGCHCLLFSLAVEVTSFM